MMPSYQDKHWRERLQDLLALGDLRDHQQLVKSLLESLKRDPHPKVRQAATEMLFARAENPVEILLKELGGESFWLDDDNVCDLASMAMTRIAQALVSSGEQAVEPLIEALERYDDWRLIEQIVGILREINDVRAIQPLTALVRRVDVRHCAYKTIKHIATRHRIRDIRLLKNPPNFVLIADLVSVLEKKELPRGKSIAIEIDAAESHRSVKLVKSPRYTPDWPRYYVHFRVHDTDELSRALRRFNCMGPKQIENPEALLKQLEKAHSQGKTVSVPVQAEISVVNAGSSVESILEDIYQLAPDCPLSVKEAQAA